MLKKIFECDNRRCIFQGPCIYEIKIEVKKLLMAAGNGDTKESQPKTISIQVCGLACALSEIEAQFRKQQVFDREKESEVLIRPGEKIAA